MKSRVTHLTLALIVLTCCGCGTSTVAQAHKGQLFDKTGAMAFWAGGDGFTGPVLGPGSYWTGYYDEIRVVDCSALTQREPMESLTKDGVQFNVDIYIRFSADCTDEKVEKLLAALSPDQGNVISREQIYNTYIRPALGEAVRKAISPMDANDINARRETILAEIRTVFLQMMVDQNPSYVKVDEVNLSNLDFPDVMEAANTDRAVQGIMRDRSVAERERVQAETQTEQMRIELARTEGKREAAKIDEVGAALKRNPEYLLYQLQGMMPEIYEKAGASGNMILAAPSPNVLVSPHKTN